MKRSDLDFSTDRTREELQDQIGQFEEFIDEIETKAKKVLDHMDLSEKTTLTDLDDVVSYLKDIRGGILNPAEKKSETVYRIIDNDTGEATGSYSRACCDEYDFGSVESARNANCHGVFKDKEKYSIAKYKVTYELIESDCQEEQ